MHGGLVLGVAAGIAFALPGCFDTTLDVTVENQTNASHEIHLLIAKAGGGEHWSKTVQLGPGETLQYQVSHTNGDYIWTATSDGIVCVVHQDVGMGDYGWQVVHAGGTLQMSFHLDDATASKDCEPRPST